MEFQSIFFECDMPSLAGASLDAGHLGKPARGLVDPDGGAVALEVASVVRVLAPELKVSLLHQGLGRAVPLRRRREGAPALWAHLLGQALVAGGAQRVSLLADEDLHWGARQAEADGALQHAAEGRPVHRGEVRLSEEKRGRGAEVGVGEKERSFQVVNVKKLQAIQ